MKHSEHTAGPDSSVCIFLMLPLLADAVFLSFLIRVLLAEWRKTFKTTFAWWCLRKLAIFKRKLSSHKAPCSEPLVCFIWKDPLRAVAVLCLYYTSIKEALGGWVAQQNFKLLLEVAHIFSFPAGKMWFKSIFITIIARRKGLYFNPRISNRAILLRVVFTGLYGTTFWMLRTFHENEGVWCVGI